MMLLRPKNRFLTAGLILFLILVFFQSLYAWLGHRVIRLAYASQWPIVTYLMRSRETTPLQNYFAAGDRLVIGSILRVLFYGVLLAFLVKRPKWLVYCAGLIVIASLLLFGMIEEFPSLIPVLHADALPYYAYKVRFTSDPELGFKQAPLINVHLYAGTEWITDQDGFRNRPSNNTDADVVVFGDGFMVGGSNENQTFCHRLQSHLFGLKVRNFGEDGQGPFAYLSVYKRYAIKSHPKYAVIGFNEGNDLQDVGSYIRWKAGTDKNSALDSMDRLNLLQKYFSALSQSFLLTKNGLWNSAGATLSRWSGLNDYSPPMDPRLAVVKFGNGSEQRMSFVDELPTQSSEEIASTSQYSQLAQILVEFKNLSSANGVVPVVLYIPASVHIYGKYSTQASGQNWLRIRDAQIAASSNLENAIVALCRKLGILVIDLVPPFDSAAKDGTVLYDLFDTHWNPDGMEFGAAYAAEVIRSLESNLKRTPEANVIRTGRFLESTN